MRLRGLCATPEMRQQFLHWPRQRVPLPEAQTKPSMSPVIADRDHFERIPAPKATGDRQRDNCYPDSLRHHLTHSLEALHTDSEFERLAQVGSEFVDMVLKRAPGLQTNELFIRDIRKADCL